MHGIVTKGGDAPNIIPDLTEGKFYVRAATVKRMMKVYHQLEDIVKGAALQTGCTGLLEPAQRNLIDNVVPTPSFDEVYRKNLVSSERPSKTKYFLSAPRTSGMYPR